MGKVGAGLRAFFAFVFGWIPPLCRGVLSMTADQRQTLMTLGMLGGMVALTFVLLFLVDIVEARFDPKAWPEGATLITGGLFDVMKLLIGLVGLMAGGMVAIAHAGKIKASVSREGATFEVEGSGAAAKALAQETSLRDMGGTQ